ncbi:MAG TPA: DUF599 domain-containing protein [Usitatibacteraceae bacterium]
MSFIPLPLGDQLALLWFLASWVGYTAFSGWKARHSPSLLSTTDSYRRRWMREMLSREQRMVDASILRNLLSGSNFFASTTMLILGGLIALMSSIGKAVDLVAGLPFTRAQSEHTLELKVLLLVLIFVYAFFKFTWSMRQFNFVSIMVGAAPAHDKVEEFDRFVERASSVAALAGENNNRGLRAYYFGITALTWFLHPIALVASSAIVVGILYHREFKSRTLKAMLA